MVRAMFGLLLPLALLLVVGVMAARGPLREVLPRAVGLALMSTVAWLVFAGLYLHDSLCDGGPPCPTVYGWDAPLADGHPLGWGLVLAGFAVPAAWAGWRHLLAPQTVGAALTVGPAVLAAWTTPRGDDDGLWAVIFLILPILGALAALLATIAGAARTRREGRLSRSG